MLEWREAAAATAVAAKEVPVLVDELEAELGAAEVKLRAVRTTPRPTTDENTVLLAIFSMTVCYCKQRTVWARGLGCSGGGLVM